MKQYLLLLLLVPVFTFSQIQIGQDINGESQSDFSGYSVSLSSDGSIIAIGAISNSNENGNSSGHVRVYRNENDNWIQIGQDIDGETINEQLGWSVSLSSDGSIVAIGGVGGDGNEIDSGIIRVYKNENDNWIQIGQDIDGETTYDQFGWSVSLSSDGSIVAIGADGYAGNTDLYGYVRVYKNENNNWIQIGQDIDGEAVQDEFGKSVSLSSNGSIIAIGAPGNDGNGNSSGHVRVYKNENNNWIQIGQDIDGENSGDGSGRSVSLSSDGSIVAIGAPGNDGNGNNSGHVRVYRNENNNWIQIGQDIDGENFDDGSGRSVSLSSDGSIIVIGADGNDGNGNNSGHVRVYKNENNNWIQIGQDIDGEAAYDLSGRSVSLSSDGSIIAIGAPGNDGNGNSSGHVRVYSIISELVLSEVIEVISGNSNGIDITGEQLNNIIGISGAIDGVNYTTALINGTYADTNNPTISEIQNIINQVNSTLSKSNFTKNFYKFYPNPTNQHFTIQLQEGLQLQNVTIYNSLGQFVMASKKTTVNTSNLSKGIYFVEVKTNKGLSTQKLIIE